MKERPNLSQMKGKDLVNFSSRLYQGDQGRANEIMKRFLNAKGGRECTNLLAPDDGRWTDGRKGDWGKHER